MSTTMTHPSQSQLHQALEDCWQLIDTEPLKAQVDAKELLQQVKSKQEKAKALCLLAFIDFRNYALDKALTKAYQAKAISEILEDKLWSIRLFNTLAVVQGHLGNYNQCFTFHKERLKVTLELNDSSEISNAHLNLALYYCNQKNINKAIEHFSKARKYAVNYRNEAFIFLNMGFFYSDEGKPSLLELAKSYAQKAFVLCEEHSMKGLMPVVLRCLSQIALKQKDYNTALKHCLNAIKQKEVFSGSASELHKKLSTIYFEQANLDNALRHALIALEQTKQENYKRNLPQVHLNLSKIYKAKADLSKALEHFESYVSLKDEVDSEENRQRQRALEIMHQTESLEREARVLEEKNKELELHVAELERLHEQVHQLSIRDALTGLYNRRYLFEQAENILKLARRYKRPFSVVMLDVDHFKSINDRFLHHTGDLVLKELANLLRLALRDADPIARYGGEEFAILLPETPLENAVIACERLRESIMSFNWASIHPQLSVTVSLGLASDNNCEKVEDLFKIADAQLYKAKQAGRNRLSY